MLTDFESSFARTSCNKIAINRLVNMARYHTVTASLHYLVK